VGVPAAHGHWGDGGADIRGALESPEHDSVCRWGVGESIGRTAHFGPVRKYAKGGSCEFRFVAEWLAGEGKRFNTEVTRDGGKSEKTMA
jgi:hypothetical protein